MKMVNFKVLSVSIFGIMLFSQKALFAADSAQASTNPLGGFFPLIIIFVIFYFFLIRPQQKKSKEHQNLLNALKKDDKIITNGGLYGIVTAVKGEIVEVKIAENVRVQIAKSAISTVVTPETPAPPVEPEIVK
jgi:preprotein translocase subunit YajC